MNQVRLFRRRFFPDELVELKNDKILSQTKDILITQWNVLKPRNDISNGISAYFINQGIKVSKIYNAKHDLVYWYCDIIDTIYDEEKNTYTFNDLLIDVLVYPDSHVEVVDMDEFADIMEKNILDQSVFIRALRQSDALLSKIYDGHFSDYTAYINEIEKKL